MVGLAGFNKTGLNVIFTKLAIVCIVCIGHFFNSSIGSNSGIDFDFVTLEA